LQHHKAAIREIPLEDLRVNMSQLPVVAHPDLTADAIHVVAEGEIDFDKRGRVDTRIEEVDAG
jgi:hypothetical protein